MSPALTDPALYAEVYSQHISFIRSVVSKVGCPPQHLDDVTSEVVLGILASDGMSRYDPARGSIKTYLARYTAQVARTALGRIWTQEARQAVLDQDFEASFDDVASAEFEEVLTHLLDVQPDDDARTFVRLASENPTYRTTRQELVDRGWETNRIRRSVRRARAAVRACR